MKRFFQVTLSIRNRLRGTKFSTLQTSMPINNTILVGKLKEYIQSEGSGSRRIVGHWLLATGALVFGIVVLGGITRLTESGLSMVDWQLIHFRPPSSEEEWTKYFQKYQEFPEYQLNNRDMTLEGFKRIYWYEHAHRVYGRLLGLFIAGPTAFFIAKKWVSPSIRNVLLGCTGLVVFQGLLGWYMVKSGLKQEIVENGEMARVSPYRLTAHLGSALVLYLIAISTGLHILTRKPITSQSPLVKVNVLSIKAWSHKLAGLVFATAITGAFVAGLDAGLIYNTFPLMGDRVIPSDIWTERLGVKNITENPATVQFIHRCMAMGTITGVSALWLFTRRSPGIPKSIKRASNIVMAMAWAQGSLGVLTLLYNVPINLASAHQAGSLGLLTSFAWLLNRLKSVARP